MRYLSPRAAKAFYDRVGRLEDSQAFYEDPALRVLLRHGRFESARSVFEFGCGTGRLAERVLGLLPRTASYRACDISPRMVALARRRLERFGDRVEIVESDGGTPEIAGHPDRIVTSYVLDLLPPEAIAAFLDAARGALAPGGLLCAASITPGPGGAARVVSSVWSGLNRLAPVLTGGCRPIRLRGFLGDGWQVLHDETVTAWGVASAVVVARPAHGGN